MSRKPNWSTEEKRFLVDTVNECLESGMNKTESFEYANIELREKFNKNQSISATTGMWYAIKRGDKSIEDEDTLQEVEKNIVVEDVVTEEVSDTVENNTVPRVQIIEVGDSILQALEQFKQVVLEAKEREEEIIKENERLKAELEEERAGNKYLMKIIEKARQMVTSEEVGVPIQERSSFVMEKNGNLERVMG